MVITIAAGEHPTAERRGGIVDTVLGLLGGYALTTAFTLPYVLCLISIVLAVGVSALVGILFGFYPAVRASQLDPIVALRTEGRPAQRCRLEATP